MDYRGRATPGQLRADLHDSAPSVAVGPGCSRRLQLVRPVGPCHRWPGRRAAGLAQSAAADYLAIVAATPHVKYRTSIVVWIVLGLLVLPILALVIIGATSR
jgi:hypothetical protein